MMLDALEPDQKGHFVALSPAQLPVIDTALERTGH
jgi:hypothetical protein